MNEQSPVSRKIKFDVSDEPIPDDELEEGISGEEFFEFMKNQLGDVDPAKLDKNKET